MKKVMIYFLCTLSLICLMNTSKVYAKEEIVIPDVVRASCEKWGEEYEICPELLEAICWHETRCRSDLENGGCLGMCQINPKYHKAEMEMLGINNLYDFDQNIHLCAQIIKDLSQKNEDLYYVLMCYNCGSTRGAELFNEGKFTRYAKEVTEQSAELERKHGK